MDDDETPISPLVNAFWGSGIKYSRLSPQQQVRVRRVLMLFTLLSATVIGVVIGLLSGPVSGAVAAVIAALFVGGVSRATLRDHE